MQILYEQDVDLGYSWNQNKPVKQLKEVDDMQKIKNDSMVCFVGNDLVRL